MMTNEKTKSTSDRELVVSRLLNAPRELVFDVWTDPKHIVKWWGPNGFTNTIHKMEVKTGGEWRLTMHGPDGTDYPNYIKYIEVVRPSKLVYKHAAEKEDEPGQFVTTVTFESQGKKTLLTMTAVFDSAEDLARVIREHGAVEGGQQTINRLEEYLKNLS